MTRPASYHQVPIWLVPADAVRKPQRATEPLRLPRSAPACFPSQRKWDQYRVLAIASASNGFTYCSDCTPEYRDKMKSVNRCKYPRTLFVIQSGVVTGKRVNGK